MESVVFLAHNTLHALDICILYWIVSSFFPPFIDKCNEEMWTADGLKRRARKTATYDQKWTAGSEQTQSQKMERQSFNAKKKQQQKTTKKCRKKSVFNMNWMEDLWLLISVASICCSFFSFCFFCSRSQMVWKVTAVILAAICIRCISYLFEWQTWTVFVDVYARAYYCLKHALQMEQAKQSNEWNKKPTKQHSHTHGHTETSSRQDFGIDILYGKGNNGAWYTLNW